MDAGAGIRDHPRRVRAVHVAIALIAALLVGIGGSVALRALLPKHAGALTVPDGASELHGEATWAAGRQPAPPIVGLRDQRGRIFSLASLRGRTVALAFFDSHCTQTCPLEGRALAAAERPLPTARRPVLVVVSVNPRDTGTSSRAAARKWGLAQAAPWHWLRGSHAQLARAWRAYHIFVAPPRHGDISHTEALYLLDRKGFERSGYLYPFATRFVSEDLRTLALARARG
jgi:cytochrome oxidase Cu insertion factor (SCO1/SenC/PrrC family)